MLATFHGQNKKKTQSSPPMQFISTPNTFNNSLDTGFPLGNKFRYRIETNQSNLSLTFDVISSTNNSITHNWLSLVDQSAYHDLEGIPLSNNTKDTLMGNTQTIRITATNSNGESITQDFTLNFIDYNISAQFSVEHSNTILLYYAPELSWKYRPVNNGINPESNNPETFMPDIGPNNIHAVLTRNDGVNMYNTYVLNGTNINHGGNRVYLVPYIRDTGGQLRRLNYGDIGNESTFIVYVRYSYENSNYYLTLFGSDSTNNNNNNGFYIGKDNNSQSTVRFQDGNISTDLSENFYNDNQGRDAFPFDYNFPQHAVIFLTRKPNPSNSSQFINELYINNEPGPLATKITSGVNSDVFVTLLGGDSYLASQGGFTDSFIGHANQLIILTQCLNSTQISTYYSNMLNGDYRPSDFIF
tara:strand:- start:78 stop:1319 length:1242 start_codon:yes stop_codon:yes gene_type:complete